ncbi:hypothetical protein [Dyadobacter sp. CY312]|uniref:hypothetical protein n=1 Tax=Dyadobacter sp. CY312 TaxID=2907303 RepID=UPI001F2A4464|nr:hypothetical protein [Dyadobacter sp. CY312]MCE7043821.1 hypothetical protein [Dyadobacter sp. CY312]
MKTQYYFLATTVLLCSFTPSQGGFKKNTRKLSDHAYNQASKGAVIQTNTGFDNQTTVTPGPFVSEDVKFTDLPERIQTFIKDRSRRNVDYLSKLPNLEKQLKEALSDKNELTFTSCSVYTSASRAVQYEVLVSYFGITNLPLIFDENGNLIWVGSFNRIESLVNFEDMSGGASKLSKEELSFFNSEFKASGQYRDFTVSEEAVSNAQASVNTYAGVKSYEFNLVKPDTKEGVGETLTLRYDGGKKLVAGFYLGKRQ